MGDSHTPDLSRPPEKAGYDPAYFAPLARIEDRHFWFRARNRAIEGLARQLESGLAGGYRVLEVGCGTGNVLRVLRRVCVRGTTLGMDLFADGLRFAQRRTDAPLLQGDVHAPPFEAGFHIIGLFDVLEHMPDDAEVLVALQRVLVPGGRLILTVPAHPGLWSYFDEAGRHCRRYREIEMLGKLVGAGYRIEYSSYFMMSLYPLLWAGRRLAALRGGQSAGEDRARELTSAELRVLPGINELLALLLAQEMRLILRRRHLPVGSSLVAIARNGTEASPH